MDAPGAFLAAIVLAFPAYLVLKVIWIILMF